MTDPTPLEIAAALRSAAEFCRDPDSPKCHGAVARDRHGNPVPAMSPSAIGWCAVGWTQRSLGGEGRIPKHMTVSDGAGISPNFDEGNYEAAALCLEAEARIIEASIPTHPATQREAVQA